MTSSHPKRFSAGEGPTLSPCVDSSVATPRSRYPVLLGPNPAATVEWYRRVVALVDVVVVSYNSARTLRGCVGSLAGNDVFNVIVVDNASSDQSLESIADLPITVLPLEGNGGFAYGCNRGWEAGSAPFVLFLNPDARIEPESLMGLASVLQQDESIGLVAPAPPPRGRVARVLATAVSRGCAPRTRGLSFSIASSLDPPGLTRSSGRGRRTSRQVARNGCPVLASWSGARHSSSWAGGTRASSCIRRTSTCVGGSGRRGTPCATSLPLTPSTWAGCPLHELSCCRRSPRAGFGTRALHRTRAAALIERIGVALEELTHAALTTKGRAARAGHLRAFRVACSLDSDAASRSARPESVRPTVEVHDASN